MVVMTTVTLRCVHRFRFDAAYINGAVYVFGGDQSSSSGQVGSQPSGLQTAESFQYTQVPDVFVWLQS